MSTTDDLLNTAASAWRAAEQTPDAETAADLGVALYRYRTAAGLSAIAAMALIKEAALEPGVRYVTEHLDPEVDDGTMPGNVATLRENVVGRRIVGVDRSGGSLTLTLDNDKRVELVDESDCCAYTELNAFLLHPERVDHIITGVGTTGGYTTWHIYADMGDVLELTVDWSCGNPFYYAYGFDIRVTEPSEGRA